MTGVVGAVAYMDRRGAVHRDIKPDNVLIADDDTAKLADFGLVKKVLQLITICFCSTTLGVYLA